MMNSPERTVPDLVGLALLAETRERERLAAARSACMEIASRHTTGGLTGFILMRQWLLFGFIEGSQDTLSEVTRDVQSDVNLQLIRTFELGRLDMRLCEGWELRVLDSKDLSKVGLDVPLEAAIRMRLTPRQRPAQREQVLRIVRRLVDTWDLADEPGADCP